MEEKTTNSSNVQKKPSIGAVIADHKAEFKKIVWPDKEDVVKKMATVIATSLIFGVIIFCYDTVYTGGIDVLMNLLGLV